MSITKPPKAKGTVEEPKLHQNGETLERTSTQLSPLANSVWGWFRRHRSEVRGQTGSRTVSQNIIQLCGWRWDSGRYGDELNMMKSNVYKLEPMLREPDDERWSVW